MKLLVFILYAIFYFNYCFCQADIDAKQIEEEWKIFKKTYARDYLSSNEENYRKSIFTNNLNFIIKHNTEKYDKGLSSFNLGVNQFSDKTLDEYRHYIRGLISNENLNENVDHYFIPELHQTDKDDDDLPKEVDWTKKGVVARVKNQGSCGSCWAFSAVAAMESANAIKNGKLVELSEQELIDCSYNEGNRGCEGGWMHKAFQYVIDNHGIDTESSYIYQAKDQKCQKENKTIGATITKYINVTEKSEAALRRAVAKFGPVSVAIDAGSPYFSAYKSGVFDYENCSQDSLNHGVVAVGYGKTEDGKEYWLVKNSWGKVWGMNGYILMSRNKNNQCGIATKASYPII